MRVISINVNGIHSAIEQGLFDWLAAQNADVICLQDTRASTYQMEAPEVQLYGYFCYACDAEKPSKAVLQFTHVFSESDYNQLRF